MTDLYDVHNARFFTQPTTEEIEASLRESFGMSDTENGHDPTNPEHVTRELMKPFPPSALYQRNKFTYVQYQQVIRRLIFATGNNFHTAVNDLRIEPWTQSSGGHQQVILIATVTLTIPVLESSRTQMGVQVATVGFGEDMWKGAVSDALKKAAQQFGVAIDLAGTDGEDTAPSQGYSTWEHEMGSPGPRDRPARLSQVQSHQSAGNAPQQPAQASTGNRQFAPAQPGTGGPATDGQKRALWRISGASKETIDQWAAAYGESNANLTKGTASVLIDTHGGQ